MADNAPGLQPRKLEGEVEVNVESNRFPAGSTASEQPIVDKPVEQAQASDNTETSVKQTEGNEEQAQVEQPLTPRAEQRIQTLAAERDAERARAANAEAMLQRLVNVQPQQPVQSEQEVLSKAYKTYDPVQGYPTDPKEYAHYVATNARLAAQQEAQRMGAQQREQQETAEFIRAYPTATTDPIFMGAMSAIKATAQRQGVYLSYKDAADQASKQLEQRGNKKIIADVANNDQSKDEAYVESTRGSSASARSAEKTPDFKNLTEMEEWLRKSGAW